MMLPPPGWSGQRDRPRLPVPAAHAVRRATPEKFEGTAGQEVPTIAAAEPIVILGRPEHLADVGWAVIVHER